MQAKPRVAILLAAYNGITWLPEQLDSILGQRNVEVSVFASVDLSTDGTEDWLLEQSRQDFRIVVLANGLARRPRLFRPPDDAID